MKQLTRDEAFKELMQTIIDCVPENEENSIWVERRHALRTASVAYCRAAVDEVLASVDKVIAKEQEDI